MEKTGDVKNDWDIQVNLGSKTHVENRCFQNGPTVGLRVEIFVFKNLTAQIKQDFCMFSYFPKYA